jgi:5'-nucleotidase
MNTRRKFLMQGGMAATALLAAKPFKAFSQYDSTHSAHGSNSVVLIHTHNLSNDRTQQAKMESLKSNKPHAILLDVGHNLKPTGLVGAAIPCCDAALPGHHAFGCHDQLLEQKTPVVVSNYDISDARLQKKVQPYQIIRKGKIRIGIIGAGSSPENAGAIRYKNPLKQLSTLATKLKEEKGCHLVVCLSNLGYKNAKNPDDVALARQSKDIDVIIGGHAGNSPRHPMIMMNKYGGEVILNHAHDTQLAPGQIEIHFDANGKKNRISFA